MLKFLYIAVFATVLVSCGEDNKVEEQVDLSTFKDKLSYVIGADHAKMVTESGDPNLSRLDYNALIEGFEKGVKSHEGMTQACIESIQGLLGPDGQDFDTTYLEAGCNCIGVSVGTVFHERWTKLGGLYKLDLAKVKIGFQHGIEKRDTLIPSAERTEIAANFTNDLNKIIVKKNKVLEVALLTKAKAISGSKVLDNGIVVEVIQEGKGGSPLANSDVKADYILTNAKGDTLESSFQYKVQRGGESPSFNLAQVIPGWTQGFQSLKKGGKYRMYIPGELAYGAQSNFEALCFYIEFIDFGEAGSIVKPQPPQFGR